MEGHARLRRFAMGVALGGALALGGAPAAFADSPFDIGGAALVDRSDVLTAAQEQTVRADLQQYTDDTGNDVFVVFVDSFTDPADSDQWATDAAEASGLSTSDPAVVLAQLQLRDLLGLPPEPHRGAVGDQRRRRAAAEER